MDDTGGNSGCFNSHDAVLIGRIDMVTGPTGRRKWPDEVKGRLVAGSYRTALSVSEFARRHGVIPSQLFGWRRDAKAGKFAVPVDEGEEVFAPLMLEAPSSSAQTQRSTAPPSGQGAGLVEMEAGGVVIRLPIDTPAARIAEIVRALA